MPCNIKNPANIDLSDLGPHVNGMYDYFDQKIGFNKPPTMVFDSDPSNQHQVLGKTAYYDPSSLEIHIYSDGRHPKDMLRSIAHELIHHRQNLEGRLNVGGYHGEGYYLENKELKKLEHEAMLEGNALMREYEDTIKKENNQMSLKEWKNNELNKLLLKKFGILKENKSNEKEYDLEENQDRVFAPSHYCAHHVVHEGKKGVTIDHNWNESLQKVTKYDVKFEDGSIVRNINESQLTVLEGMSHGGKRDDDHPKVKKDEKELEEAEKPDFPDVDGDGDKEEPISKAQQDKKEKEGNSDKEEDDSDKENEKSDDKDLSKVPPQLRKHVKSKMKQETKKDNPKKSKYPEKDFPHDSSALKHRNESKVNLKQLIERVLKNNKKTMKKLKDK